MAETWDSVPEGQGVSSAYEYWVQMRTTVLAQQIQSADNLTQRDLT